MVERIILRLAGPITLAIVLAVTACTRAILG